MASIVTLPANATMPVLLPLQPRDIAGFMLVAAAVSFSAGGGLGGGGILVPIIILVMDIHASYAIPLSNATIMGSSFWLCLINITR